MIKLIIFDFDGTIADTYQAIKEIALNLDEFKNKDIKIEEIKELSIKNILKKYNVPLWKFSKIVRIVKIQLSDKIEREANTFKGLSKVLIKLSKNHDLSILSSNSDENIRKFLIRNNLQGIFKTIYSDSAIFGKHKKIKRLLRKLKISKDEVIYVGDEVRDIEACKKIGIPIISVSWGYNSKSFLKQNKPDYLASSPKELEKILLTLNSNN